MFLSQQNKDFFVKICDFGCACKVDQFTKRISLCGTCEYMAPEMLNNPNSESHSFSVDIWCLGLLLFEMLHGYLMRTFIIPIQKHIRYKKRTAF